MPLLSVVIPVYNEQETIIPLIRKVLAVDIDKEVIIVDDASSDETMNKIKDSGFTGRSEVTLFRHDRNKGKGAALKTGFSKAKGEVVIIQDADLEYNPDEYLRLVEPILNRESDIVFGTRFHNQNPLKAVLSRLSGKADREILYLHHYLGVQFLNLLISILYGVRLTDGNTCYKVFRREVIQGMDLKSDGFEFCPEFVAQACLKGYSIKELPISYDPRSGDQGKKLKWTAGLTAISTLITCRLNGRSKVR